MSDNETKLSELIEEIRSYADIELFDAGDNPFLDDETPAKEDAIEDAIAILQKFKKYTEFVSVDISSLGTIFIIWTSDNAIISSEVGTGHRISFYRTDSEYNSILESMEMTDDFEYGIKRLSDNLKYLNSVDFPKTVDHSETPPVPTELVPEMELEKPTGNVHYTELI